MKTEIIIEQKTELTVSSKIMVALIMVTAMIGGLGIIFGLISLSQTNKNKTPYTEYSFKVTFPDNYALNQIKGTDGNDYFFYTHSDYQNLQEAGKPALLSRKINVRIPSDAKNVALIVEKAVTKTDPINNPIYPAEKQIVKENNKVNPPVQYTEGQFFLDRDFYKKTKNIYPTQPAKIVELSEMRGLHYAVVEVYPLQYTASGKLLTANSQIDLKLQYTTTADKTPKKFGETFQKNIEGLNLINPPPVKNYSVLERLAETASGTVNWPTNLLDNTPTDYLIITADDFYNNSNLATLANHRASEAGGGYQVTVVNTSDIYNTTFPDTSLCPSPCGNDRKIKIFLKYAYDHWNGEETPLQFALLVGDGDGAVGSLIPIHTSSYEYLNERVATDFWYTTLGGDTPALYLNDLYDKVGDLALGRFPVKSKIGDPDEFGELARMVNKTLKFEIEFPNQTGVEKTWHNQTGLVNNHAASSAYAATINAVIQSIRNYYLVPHQLQSMETYRSNYSSPAEFTAELKNQFNAGRILMASFAHGSKITWNDSVATVFDTNNVQQLTNQNKLPILFSFACQNGYFDDLTFESLGETFVKSKNAGGEETGAVAGLFVSRTAGLSSSNVLATKLFAELLDHHNLILGQGILTAKNSDIFANRLLYNLLGDPALNITAVLDDLTIPDFSGTITNVARQQQNLLVFADLKNIGKVEGQNVLIEVYDGNPASGGTIIQNQRINLPGGKTTNSIISLTIPPSWDQEQKTFYLVIDGSGEIDEANENNNVSGPLSFYIDLQGGSFVGKNVETPDIDGHYIVWGNSKPNINISNIYLYYLGENGLLDPANDSSEWEKQITYSDSDSQVNPVIDGNKIVWADYLGNIMLYDLNNQSAGPQKIVSSTTNKNNLAINGDKIVWRSPDPVYNRIFMFDLAHPEAGVRRITNDYSNQQNPDIYGDKIVWQDNQNGNDDIYLYDLSQPGLGKQRLTTNTSNQTNPKIYNNKIVWQDNQNVNADIYLYDLSHPELGQQRLTTNTANQLTPQIYDNKVIWLDDRNGYEVYWYDLTTGQETRIAASPSSWYMNGPKISGNNIIYLTGSSELYLYTIPNHPPVLNPIGNKEIYINNTLKFLVTATDQDIDPLAYHIIYKDETPPIEGNSFTKNLGGTGYVFSWTPTVSQLGTHGLGFIVSDGRSFDSELITITVKQKEPYQWLKEINYSE